MPPAGLPHRPTPHARARARHGIRDKRSIRLRRRHALRHHPGSHRRTAHRRRARDRQAGPRATALPPPRPLTPFLHDVDQEHRSSATGEVVAKQHPHPQSQSQSAPSFTASRRAGWTGCRMLPDQVGPPGSWAPRTAPSQPTCWTPRRPRVSPGPPPPCATGSEPAPRTPAKPITKRTRHVKAVPVPAGRPHLTHFGRQAPRPLAAASTRSQSSHPACWGQ